MKKLMIAFGAIMIWATPVQAQYQELIDTKIVQLLQLQKQVVVAGLVDEDRGTALDTLATNLELLTTNRDEIDLAKLQQLETEINQINRTLAAKILEVKKAKLAQKLDVLANMIVERQASGLDTAQLEKLWNQMDQVLQNL